MPVVLFAGHRSPRDKDCSGQENQLWAGAYIGCGFLFARQLDKVAMRISTGATAVVLIFGIPLLIFFVLKLAQLVLMIHLLRPLHIRAEMLKSRLDSGEKFGVVDLLRFEEDPEGVATIPEAVRLDPLEIRRKERIVIPSDVNLVLYSSSRNCFVSARLAVAMRKHGIHNIHVLAGGLEAWKGLGFPLTEQFADMETEVARLGIEVSHPGSTFPFESRKQPLLRARFCIAPAQDFRSLSARPCPERGRQHLPPNRVFPRVQLHYRSSHMLRLPGWIKLP
jgi:rhodanese-related sulfurtransferase